VEQTNKTKNQKFRKQEDQSCEFLHLHFVGWPDHETPQHSRSILDVMQTLNEKAQKGPIIVHCRLSPQNRFYPLKISPFSSFFPGPGSCSAGVGRTGSWILVSTLVNLIDIKLRLQEPPPLLNCLELLKIMRQQRAGLVSHRDQYKWSYETILQHLEHQLTTLFWL
jgi:protein tyrosine phosphatase